MNIILLFLASITCAAGRTSMPVLQLLQAGQVDTAALKTDSVTSAKLLSDSGGLAKVAGGAASVSGSAVLIKPGGTESARFDTAANGGTGLSTALTLVGSSLTLTNDNGIQFRGAAESCIIGINSSQGFCTDSDVNNDQPFTRSYYNFKVKTYDETSAYRTNLIITGAGSAAKMGLRTENPASTFHMSSGILTIDGNLSGLRIVEPSVNTVKLSIDPVSGSATFGSSMTVGGPIRVAGTITIPNQNALRCEDSGGSPRDLFIMTSANNLSIGNSAAVIGRIDFYPGQSAGLHMYKAGDGGARFDSTLTSISSVTLAGTTPVLRVGTNVSGSIIIDSGASDTAKLQIGSLTRPGCFTMAYANTTGCAECCMISGNTTPTCGNDADCVVDGTP